MVKIANEMVVINFRNLSTSKENFFFLKLLSNLRDVAVLFVVSRGKGMFQRALSLSC